MNSHRHPSACGSLKGSRASLSQPSGGRPPSDATRSGQFQGSLRFASGDLQERRSRLVIASGGAGGRRGAGRNGTENGLMSVWERHIDDEFDAVAARYRCPSTRSASTSTAATRPERRPSTTSAAARSRFVSGSSPSTSRSSPSSGERSCCCPAGRAAVDVTAAVAAVVCGFLSARARGPLHHLGQHDAGRRAVAAHVDRGGQRLRGVGHLPLARPPQRRGLADRVAAPSPPSCSSPSAAPSSTAGSSVHRSAGRYCRSVVLVGTEADVDEVSRLLADHQELGYQIVGWVGPTGDGVGADRLGDVERRPPPHRGRRRLRCAHPRRRFGSQRGQRRDP